MKNKIKYILLATLLTATSCGKSSNASSDSGSSFIPPEPVTLQEAIENTQSYSLYYKYGDNDDLAGYTEIVSPKTYSYVNGGFGYTVLDSDPDYMHMYSYGYDNDAGVYITMNGRVGSSDDIKTLQKQATTFISLIDGFSTIFKVDPDDPWKYTYYGTGVCKAFNQFFQLKEFNYCTYYELTIGYDGRISRFRAGETSSDELLDLFYTEDFYLNDFDFKDTEYAKDWAKKGSPIETRIVDYKSFYHKGLSSIQCYTSGEVEATVTAVDYDGSFYIANYDKYYGQVGMKVVLNESCKYVPKVLDKVYVQGDIHMDTLEGTKDSYSPYFVNATATKVGESTYIPCYSEESLVDTYGAGVYAAYYLSGSPIYSHSSYSCYGYPSNIPETANMDGDTVVDIVCPNWTYDIDGSALTMKLYMPKEYGLERINAILDEFRTMGDYSKSPANPKLAYLGNVILYYSFSASSSGKPSLDLYAVSNSVISHRLSVAELVENEYGLADFPEPVSKQLTTFHFGDVAQYYLEPLYGINNYSANGIFLNAANVTGANVQKYMNGLVNDWGATFIDCFSCSITSYYQHYVFIKEDVYIDICSTLSSDDAYSMYIFIYKADKMVRSASIEERIDSTVGSFFSSDEFIKLDDTYDKDYNVYQLDNYAGNEFSDDNKLTIVTLDITTDRYKDLRDAYRAAGWKQWREDINDPYSKAYTYVTRGVSHIVYYKQNENGKYTFLDFASYPTSDYTFLYHDRFNPRIEIAIYEGDSPLSTKYTRDLNKFLIGADVPSKLMWEWELPEGYKAEVWYEQRNTGLDRFYDYGYTFDGDAFIYPDNTANLDTLYQYIIDTLTAHGYSYSYTGKKGVCYSYIDNEAYEFSYFYIMKDSRGFVRLHDSIGGADF